MKKTFVAVALTVAVMSLATGCGNADVLDRLDTMEENMDERFNRLEEKIDSLQPTSSQEDVPAEQPAETEKAQEQAPSEQPAQTEETQEQATAKTEVTQEEQATPSTGFQIFALHNGNTIPVAFTEGTLKDTSGACVSKATNLNAEENKILRDVTFVFIGEDVLNVSWVNGNTYSGIDALLAEPMTNNISSTAFNMKEAEGIYSFEVTLKSGKVYSFSIKYHYDNVI